MLWTLIGQFSVMRQSCSVRHTMSHLRFCRAGIAKHRKQPKTFWLFSVCFPQFLVSLVWLVSVTVSVRVSVGVVTTTELSPPQRWLATIKPAPPLRCFTVFSTVFLGAVSWKLQLIFAALFDPWVNAQRVGNTARPPLHVHIPTRKR